MLTQDIRKNKTKPEARRTEGSGATAGYVAVFRRTIQTSEDSWNVKTETKICGASTTIGEVIRWAEKFKETAFNVEISKAA